jgi:hypothetical protein
MNLRPAKPAVEVNKARRPAIPGAARLPPQRRAVFPRF